MVERLLPAYPLFVKDPNFSLWSQGELLNESHVKSWWGEEKKIFGVVRTEGRTYCFLGDGAELSGCGVEKAVQTALSVTAFSTDYEFEAGKVRLKIRFVSPLPPDDPELLSLPVCYMEYEMEGDGQAQLALFVNRGIAYNKMPDQSGHCVRGGTVNLKGFQCAFFGLRRQLPLSNNGDAMGADWGYFYLSGERACILDEAELTAWLAGGCTDFACVGEERYLGSWNSARKGAVLLGYDDLVSVDYFGTFLKGYYLENHTIIEALETVYHNRGVINEKLAVFERGLRERCREYGEEYLSVLFASLRQSVGAHKLVKNRRGELLFLSKECCSNGCIATVDVSYPSAPLFLLYNPELVKGMMRPILEFAKMPVWPFDFAPHDVGTYPACCGQVYGLKTGEGSRFRCLLKQQEGTEETHFPLYLLPEGSDVYDEKQQMPVEECANMLILFLACYRFDGDIGFFSKEAALAGNWVEFLVKYGLKPANQLCTDDFAGHLKNNLNLAIKATVGIAAYAELIRGAGDGRTADEYRRIAVEYAGEITALGEKYGRLPLTWDSDETTFSLKYNLAFDRILGLGLFSQAFREREADSCLAKMERFGVPLDSRAGYTKSDWLIWTASLTENAEKRMRLVRAVADFLRESSDRVPFADWYESTNGEMKGFRARSVQGGCFILLLCCFPQC